MNRRAAACPLLLAALALAPAAHADEVVVTQVSSIATTLDPAWEPHIAACTFFRPRDVLLELAKLDGPDFVPNATAWSELLGGNYLGGGDTPVLAFSGPLILTTRPAPAQDVTVQTDLGTIVACLPDTSSLELGAAFAVDLEGTSWWLDSNHDGLSAEDLLAPADAVDPSHLARSCDEPLGPLPPPPVRPELRPATVTPITGRAFEFAWQVDEGETLAWPDGSPFDPSQLGRSLGLVLGVTDDGLDVSSPLRPGPTGRAEPLHAAPADLSDAAGWPEPEVPPGSLAVDLDLGRFAFSAGAPDLEVELLSHLHTHWGGGHFGRRFGDLYLMVLGESDASLVVVDVSDPLDPQLAGSVNCGWAYGVVVVEDHAWVYGRSGLTGVDLNDPTDPTIVAEVDFAHGGFSVSIADFGEDLLLVSNGDAIATVDVSDPPAPQILVDQPLSLGLDENLYLDESANGYVTEVSATGQRLLHLVDLSDPTTPQLLATIAPTEELVDLTAGRLVDDLLYVTTSGDGLIVFDLSDPASPQEIYRYEAYPLPPLSLLDYKDNDLTLTVDGDRLWVGGHYGWGDGTHGDIDARVPLSYLREFDIADPTAISLLSEWQEPTFYFRPGGIQVEGDLAFLFDRGFGLRVADLSTPDLLDWQAGYHAIGMGVDVVLQGQTAWMSQYLGGGVVTIDVSDPSSPQRVDLLPDGMDVYAIAVTDGRWLHRSGKSTVSYYGGGPWRYSALTTFDLDAPDLPAYVSTSGGTFHMAADHHGDLLSADGALWTLEDPAAPRLLRDGAPMGGEPAARVGDHLVYGPGRISMLPLGEVEYRAMPVWDLANRAAPTLVALLPIPDCSSQFMSDLVVRGGVAWTDDGAGVLGVDVSDPRNPSIATRVSEATVGMNVGSVDVLEDFLVLQQEDGLLRVYDIAGGVEAPTLLGEGFAYYTRKTEVHGTVAHTPTANGLYLFSVPRSSQEPAGPVAMWYRVAQLPIGDDDDSADPGDDDSADPDDDDSADPGDDDSADPGDDDDSAASDDDVVDDDDSGGPGPTSCTCSSGPSAVGPLLMLPGLLAVRRRRRRPI